MDVDFFLSDSKAKELYKTFLEVGHTNDESVAMRELRCYELSDQLHKTADSFGDNEYKMVIDKLREKLPSELWENLLDAIKQGDKVAMRSFLALLKNEERHNIQMNPEFIVFKKAMIDGSEL